MKDQKRKAENIPIIQALNLEQLANIRLLIDVDIKNFCVRKTLLKDSHILVDISDETSIQMAVNSFNNNQKQHT